MSERGTEVEAEELSILSPVAVCYGTCNADKQNWCHVCFTFCRMQSETFPWLKKIYIYFFLFYFPTVVVYSELC